MTSRGQHLTESEFVDLFDGTLVPVRRQHVESCAACASQAADLAMSARGVERVVEQIDELGFAEVIGAAGHRSPSRSSFFKLASA